MPRSGQEDLSFPESTKTNSQPLMSEIAGRVLLVADMNYVGYSHHEPGPTQQFIPFLGCQHYWYGPYGPGIARPSLRGHVFHSYHVKLCLDISKTRCCQNWKPFYLDPNQYWCCGVSHKHRALSVCRPRDCAKLYKIIDSGWHSAILTQIYCFFFPFARQPCQHSCIKWC